MLGTAFSISLLFAFKYFSANAPASALMDYITALYLKKNQKPKYFVLICENKYLCVF
jgi:hypothetical protein